MSFSRRLFVIAITLIAASSFSTAADSFTFDTPVGPLLLNNLTVTSSAALGFMLTGTVTNTTSAQVSSLEFELALADRNGDPVTCQNVLHGGLIGCNSFVMMESVVMPGEKKPFSSPLLGAGGLLVGSIGEIIDVKLEHLNCDVRYSFSLTKPVTSQQLHFEDASLRIGFVLGMKEIGFELANKTDGPIRIDWNSLSYIDPSGKAHGLIHKGVKFANKEQPQAPATVPPTAAISDTVAPVDNVYSSSGTWDQTVLLPSVPFDPAARRTEISEALASKQKDNQARLESKLKDNKARQRETERTLQNGELSPDAYFTARERQVDEERDAKIVAAIEERDAETVAALRISREVDHTGIDVMNAEEVRGLKALQGRVLSLFFPLEIDGKTANYLFSMRIDTASF